MSTSEQWGPHVFRDGVPLKIQGTGTTAVTITHQPGQNPNSHVIGSSIQVRIYADHTRLPDGSAPVENGTDRAWEIHGRLDQLLSKPGYVHTPDAWFQIERTSQPLESFDREQNIPYLTVTYSVIIHADPKA